MPGRLVNRVLRSHPASGEARSPQLTSFSAFQRLQALALPACSHQLNEHGVALPDEMLERAGVMARSA